MRKKSGIIKRALSLLLIFLLSINSFAATSVNDNDGSAFITKAEFDALKSSFQAQIDTYNQNIDSKIDAAIASYLTGINISREIQQKIVLNDYYNFPCSIGLDDQRWNKNKRYSLKYTIEYNKIVRKSSGDVSSSSTGKFASILYVFSNGFVNAPPVILAHKDSASNYGIVSGYANFTTKNWQSKLINDMWGFSSFTTEENYKSVDSMDLYQIKSHGTSYAKPMPNGDGNECGLWNTTTGTKFYINNTKFKWPFGLYVLYKGDDTITLPTTQKWTYKGKTTAGINGSGIYQGAGGYDDNCDINEYKIKKIDSLIDNKTANLFVIDTDKNYFYPFWTYPIADITEDYDQSAYACESINPIRPGGTSYNWCGSSPDLWPRKYSTAPTDYNTWKTNFDSRYDNIIPTSLLKWKYTVDGTDYLVNNYGGVPITKLSNDGEVTLEMKFNKTAGAATSGIRVYFSKQPFNSWTPATTDVIQAKLGTTTASYHDIKSSGVYTFNLGMMDKDNVIWAQMQRLNDDVIMNFEINKCIVKT